MNDKDDPPRSYLGRPDPVRLALLRQLGRARKAGLPGWLAEKALKEAVPDYGEVVGDLLDIGFIAWGGGEAGSRYRLTALGFTALAVDAATWGGGNVSGLSSAMPGSDTTHAPTPESA